MTPLGSPPAPAALQQQSLGDANVPQPVNTPVRESSQPPNTPTAETSQPANAPRLDASQPASTTAAGTSQPASEPSVHDPQPAPNVDNVLLRQSLELKEQQLQNKTASMINMLDQINALRQDQDNKDQLLKHQDAVITELRAKVQGLEESRNSLNYAHELIGSAWQNRQELKTGNLEMTEVKRLAQHLVQVYGTEQAASQEAQRQAALKNSQLRAQLNSQAEELRQQQEASRGACELKARLDSQAEELRQQQEAVKSAHERYKAKKGAWMKAHQLILDRLQAAPPQQEIAAMKQSVLKLQKRLWAANKRTKAVVQERQQLLEEQGSSEKQHNMLFDVCLKDIREARRKLCRKTGTLKRLRAYTDCLHESKIDAEGQLAQHTEQAASQLAEQKRRLCKGPQSQQKQGTCEQQGSSKQQTKFIPYRNNMKTHCNAVSGS